MQNKIIIKLNEIKNNIKKYVELCRLLYTDPGTPKLAKILLWVSLAYALSPIDLIPDFLPVIGYLDDIIILPFLLYIAIKLVPSDVYLENYNKAFRK